MNDSILSSAAPDADNQPEKKYVKTLEAESEGCVSSEGSRIGGFIIEEIQE